MDNEDIMARLSERKAVDNDRVGDTPPVGAIMAYAPGYYTAIDNGGFTITGPSGNTVNECNTFLPDNWRVCDGAAINDAESPIWNAAGRRLPELTDSRFMRGATAAGSAAGANTKTLNTPQLPSHGHSASSGTDDAPHGHTAVGNTANATHNTPAGGVPTANAPVRSPSQVRLTEGPWVASSPSGPDSWAMNAIISPIGTYYAPHGHSASPNGAVNAPHGHPVTVVANNAPHSHTVTVTATGSGDSFDIQPNYVNVFYIIRIK